MGAALPAAAALLLAVLLAALTVGACGGEEVAPEPAEPLVGRRFPSVVGEALSGAAVRLPEDFVGAPLIVVVAPAGEAQEDADRYLVSLRSRGAAFVETPVLASLVTRLTQRYHNGKLKETEPRDMWGRIVPLYKDGAVLAEFIGEVEDETRALVLVLDRDGVIRFLDDGGYDPATLEAAVAAYESLGP
ncbi:MAG: hypothetical protein JW767_05595 [Thermoleophilia bacterium]|nr:hypothetical protein [Thermoleophilia bacterium]